MVKLSTDKKIEGEMFTDEKYKALISTISSIKTIEDSLTIRIVTPIMNLDKRASVLVVEVSK